MTVASKVEAPEVSILGVRVQGWTRGALHDEILRLVRSGAHEAVLNVNVHALNLAWRHEWLRDYFNSARVVFCDGAGVRLAARLLGHRLPPRITYADWIWELAAFAAAHGLSLFLLGGRPGIADRAADRLRARRPELLVAGCHDGFFDRTPGSSANRAVVSEVNRARPDILLVAFGMPGQERWLDENWEQLNARVALTGGAVLDYASGTLRRAPRWLTSHGLEWLGRLVIEPRRLWRRYVIGIPAFLWRVMLQRAGLLRLPMPSSR